MRVVLGLLVWSLAEISAFVVVGGWIGLAGVLVLVLGSGVLGVAILRRQGDGVARMREGRQALMAAGDAGLMMAAGLLLVLPGLLTDVAGAVLLVPAVRKAILRRIAGRIVRPRGPEMTGAGVIVEATAVEVPPANEPRQPSGWTKP